MATPYQNLLKQRRRRARQKFTYKGTTYQVGDIVSHPKFGKGDIISMLQLDDPRDRSVIIGNDRQTFRGLVSELTLVKKNPSPADDQSPDDRDAAVGKYEEFHRYAPTAIGDFPRGFMIPRTMLRVGPAKWVTYRSGKVDPSTLKKPRKPVDYIHEHDAGVEVFVTLEEGAENGWTGTDSDLDLEAVDVPAEFRKVGALVLLGENLGFSFDLQGEKVEAVGDGDLPELYCTPCGKCLLVIQDKTDVLAMMWGGALGVFARGIDG